MERLMKINRNIEYYGNDIVMIDTIQDGSSMLHSIMMSISKEYKMNKINRKEMVKNLRVNLSNKLSTKKSLDDKLTYYEELSGGRYKELSKRIKKLSLDNMMRELKSNENIDDIYIEYISNVLNYDIYVFDYGTMDVKMVGTKYEYMYKGRKSVCIIKKNGYYKLMGLQNNTGKIRTNYEYKDKYIKLNNNRKNIKYISKSN